MSKQLFEFVKVAAGTVFPFETGTFYSHFDDTPKEFWMSRIVKGSVHHKDYYILRPAESLDGGREGDAADYVDRFDIKGMYGDLSEAIQVHIMTFGEHCFRAGQNLQFPTPADPGSQVEAALNWINENMPGLYVNQPVWSIETHDPAGFESDSSKEVDYTTADLITLYKQSL